MQNTQNIQSLLVDHEHVRAMNASPTNTHQQLSVTSQLETELDSLTASYTVNDGGLNTEEIATSGNIPVTEPMSTSRFPRTETRKQMPPP